MKSTGHPPRPGAWRRRLIAVLCCVIVAGLGLRFFEKSNWNPGRTVGQAMDSLDGVAVFYNGGVGQTHGRNTSPDGYNVGLRYQCVEFVKRYYLEVHGHKMPDSHGHARDFFEKGLEDGKLNTRRGLLQFRNGAGSLPRKGDLLVWDGSLWNPYGHVAIVAAVGEHTLTLIQQNPGPFGSARAELALDERDGKPRVDDGGLLGWLRMPASATHHAP